VIRGFLVLTLVSGCGRIAFDELDARSNGDGVLQQGCAAELTAYGDTICVRRTDGHVWCWGQGDQGALGDGSLADRYVPGPSLVTDAIDLTSGEDTICAIRADRTVSCWGAGDLGQVGDGGGTDRNVPSPVSLPGPVAEIAAAQSHVCARLIDGRGYCWGNNTFNELGPTATGVQAHTPAPAPIGTAKQVAVGDNVTCMIEANDAASCFGRNDEGELGDGTPSVSRSTPMPIAGISETVTQLSAGCHRHLCAVGASGAVYCWGENLEGQVGTGATSAYETPPRLVTGIPPAQRVSVGGTHTCILALNGEMWCWGRGDAGSLGNGSVASSLKPTRVVGFTGRAVNIQSSCAATHALRDDGTIVAWGASQVLGTGQLGDATTPVDVDIPCD
jgi:alpha-tubulin suppressor-like RCC1 family protein